MSTDYPHEEIRNMREARGDSARPEPRRKVRWVRSRDGRSKYAPHAGQKELAKLVGREGTSND